jgi:hypothetical protein
MGQKEFRSFERMGERMSAIFSMPDHSMPDQTLDEYLQTLNRKPGRNITLPSGRVIKIQGFQICKDTQKIYRIGIGYRRSYNDPPINGQVLGSFKVLGGSGYFMRRLDDGKIIQVQCFHVCESVQTGEHYV